MKRFNIAASTVCTILLFKHSLSISAELFCSRLGINPSCRMPSKQDCEVSHFLTRDTDVCAGETA